jgi:hypothetical protein
MRRMKELPSTIKILRPQIVLSIEVFGMEMAIAR